MVPNNFKDLSAVERDRLFNELLAKSEAKLANSLANLSFADECEEEKLPPEFDEALAAVDVAREDARSALEGALEAVQALRQDCRESLSTAVGEVSESQDVPSFTSDTLFERLKPLLAHVIADPRWIDNDDDLGVSVCAMLLYGFAVATGRIYMFLDLQEIDAAVFRCITEQIGAAPMWTQGLLAEANASAFDASHHPGQHQLIGVGHSFLGKDEDRILESIFATLQSFRDASK